MSRFNDLRKRGISLLTAAFDKETFDIKELEPRVIDALKIINEYESKVKIK